MNSKGTLKTGSAIVIDFCFTALPFFFGLLLFFPRITLAMNQITEQIILKLLPATDVRIIQTPFLHQQLSYISFSGGEPTTGMKLFFAALAAVIILITRNVKIPIPYQLISYFFSSLILASSTVLLFFPNAFPYTIGSFAEINMKLQVLLWLVFPLMLSVLLLQITPTLLQKFAFISALLISTIALSTIKYAFSLYALLRCSFIFTPLLFFIFGPYMDLVYLVAFFALFTSRLKT